MGEVPECENKKINIEWSGKKLVFVIRQLTYEEFNELESQTANLKIRGNKREGDIHSKPVRELMLLKGIMEAPFDITIQNIRKLPSPLALKLFDQINTFNSFDDQEKETSSGQQNTAPQDKTSQKTSPMPSAP